jgi:hypothetical protein
LDELRFEWDDEKAAANYRNHRVRFEEAETVWDDPHRVEAADEEHSEAKIAGSRLVCRAASGYLRWLTPKEMKRSVSSQLEERIRQRKAVTPAKHRVRKVKFTPEEMAYDLPKDVSHLPFRRVKPKIELDHDVAEVFSDSAAVNKALRKLIEAMPAPSRRKRLREAGRGRA